MSVSVIIPALNEEAFIQKTIRSIRQYAPPSTEIILIDNGSTDKTVDLAKENGARTKLVPGATIAQLRNEGVALSSGDVLVFIDADVQVTQQWGEELNNTVIPLLERTPMTVTGSRCLAPVDGTFLNTHWFNLLTQYEAPYINSGHLITTRALFQAINGFSEHLVTAEDYDFCQKAKLAHATIINNSKLSVFHYGYPTTLSGFIARERWHGKEDFISFQSFVSSKVAIITCATLLVTLLLIGLLLLTLNAVYLLPLLLFLATTSVALTLVKFGRGKVIALAPTAFIFVLYLIGRSLSLFDRLMGLTKRGS